MDLDSRSKFWNPPIERIVLSYCFKSIDYYYDVSSKMTESDFLSPDHQLLFVLMKNLINDGAKSLDISMVIAQAQTNGVLGTFEGGAGYIQSIYNIEASKDNFDKYITDLLEASTKYRTYITLNQHLGIIKSNAQQGRDSTSLINNVESDLLDITSKSTLNEDPNELGDSLEQFIEERRNAKKEMSGLSTGFPILDKQIDGLIPGTLMVIAARKKMGKSTFITNIGLNVAYRLQKPVLYIDTELTFREWRTRALSCMSGVKERDVKHGGYTTEQYKKLMFAKRIISKGKLFHKYMPGFSVDRVVAICKKYKLKEDIGMIIFDYIKEPDLSSVEGNRKEYQLLGDITTKLKDLAGILDVPVLTAVQLNRSNDIADSDRIARYGDIIAMWSNRTGAEREEAGKDIGNYKLVIKDTRRGGSTQPEGIGYWFFKQCLTIREVSPDKQYFCTMGEESYDYDDADEDMYKQEISNEIY